MNNSNIVTELVDAFRNNDYTKAEVEFSLSNSQGDDMNEVNNVIDLELTGKSQYGIPSPAPAIPMPSTCLPYRSNGIPHCTAPSYPPNFTLEYLRSFKCSWEKPSVKTQKNNKGYIELASPSSFSEEFTNSLGEHNTTNIQGIDDENLRDVIFIGLLEQEARHQYINKSNPRLENLLLLQTPHGCVHGRIEDNTLKWSIGGNQGKCPGFILLIQALLTIPFMDAAATLANILNMNIDYLFSVSTVDKRSAEIQYQVCQFDNSYNCIQLLHLPPEKSMMIRTGIINIWGHSQQIIGAILTYSLNNHTLCVPATVVRGQLSIGKHKPSAFFLNQDKIDKNPNCTIILCQDLRLATALDKMIQESQKLSDLEIVVTGHIGIDLSVFPWNYFYGHRVILICAPTKQSFSAVKGYKEYTEKAGVVDVKVYPYPILHTNAPGASSMTSFGLDPLEEELHLKKTVLSSVESIFTLVQKIQQEAMPYESFVKWGKNNKLFKVNDMASNCHNPETSPLFEIGEQMNPVTNIFEEILFEDIFLSESITMLHAPKDAGKSLCAFAVLKGASTGETTFGFAMKKDPIKALLFDSETPPDVFATRIAQLQVQNDNAPCISKVAVKNGVWSKFDLLNKEHRNVLMDYMLKMV